MNTGLNIGPAPLERASIGMLTASLAGAYALTRHSTAHTFYVSYVGRSDTDLKRRLLEHAAEGVYSHFRAGYFLASGSAFQKECHLFHDFGETATLDNDIHPARPYGVNWTCPRCRIFG